MEWGLASYSQLFLGHTVTWGTDAGMVGCGLAGSFQQLLSWRWITGLGSALQMAGAQLYLADISSPSNRARVLGTNQARSVQLINLRPHAFLHWPSLCVHNHQTSVLARLPMLPRALKILCLKRPTSLDQSRSLKLHWEVHNFKPIHLNHKCQELCSIVLWKRFIKAPTLVLPDLGGPICRQPHCLGPY